jgi:hypothetical protein
MKKIFVVLIVCIALCLCAIPVSSRDVIDNSPTIYIGEEHLNMKFLEGSQTKTFGWWEGPIEYSTASKIIRLGDSYADASFPTSEFAGYTGTWRSLDSELNLDLKGPYFTLLNPVVTATPTPRRKLLQLLLRFLQR